MTNKQKRNLLKKFGAVVATLTIATASVTPAFVVFADESVPTEVVGDGETIQEETKTPELHGLEESIVTPETLIKNRTIYVSEDETFEPWKVSFYSKGTGLIPIEKLGAKNKDPKDPYYSVGTKAWLGLNGKETGTSNDVLTMRTQHDSDENSTIVEQKIQVKKGQTYQLAFDAKDYDQSTNLALQKNYGKLILTFGMGDAIKPVEVGVTENFGIPLFPDNQTVIPKDWKSFSFKYTAIADGEATVKFRVYTYRGAGGDYYTTLGMKNLKLINTDVTAPTEPTVTSTVDTAASVISGAAEANATVNIYNLKTKALIGTGKADENGQYSVTIKRQVAGETIVVNATDVAGNISKGVQKLVVQGAMVTPTINEITNQDLAIKGTADPASIVTIKVVGTDNTTKVLDNVTADLDGNFSYPLEKALAYLDKITAQTKVGAIQSEEVTAIVKDAIHPAVPSVEVIGENDTKVHGTADAGNRVVAILPDSTTIETNVAEDGTFSLDIPAQEVGSVIKFKQVKPSGLESELVEVTVQKISIAEPEVNVIKDTDILISGTGEARSDVTIKVFDKDHNLIGTVEGSTNSKGKFALLTENLAEAAYVEVSLSRDDLISRPVVVNVQDTTAPEAPVVDSLVKEDTKVTGTAEAGATVIVSVNGVEIGRGTANAEGAFAIEIAKQEKDTVVSVVAQDAANNVSLATKVTVADLKLTAPTVDELTNKSTKITGTALKNSNLTLTVYSPKGEVLQTLEGEVGSNGKFLFNLDEALVEGSSVEAIVTKDGLDSEVTLVTVKDVIAPEAPQLNAVTEYSDQITGKSEAGTTIILTVNGKEIGRGFAGADGSFAVNILKQTNGSVISAVAVDAAGNTSEVANKVVSETVGTITPDAISVGAFFITGSYTGDVTRGRLIIDGQVVSLGGEFADGKFTYYVGPNTLKSKNQTVVLEGLDNDYKTLDTKTLTATNTAAGTIVTAEHVFGSGWITGTYTGDVVKARLTIDGKVVSWGGSFADGTFSYYAGTDVIWKRDHVITLAAFDKFEDQLTDEFTVGTKTVTAEVTEAKYKVGSSFITGKYTGTPYRASVSVDGKVVSWGGDFKADGTFSYYINPTAIKADSNVVITLHDGLDNEIHQFTLSDIDAPKGSVSFNKVSASEYFAKGVFTGEVAKLELKVDGNTISWGGDFAADGTFSYYTGNLQEGQVITFNAYDSSNNLLQQDVSLTVAP